MKSIFGMACSFILIVTIASASRADTIALVPVAGFPTGANADALAGPLFDSDIKTEDIAGPTMGSLTASKFGNTATHTFAIELDYTMGPAYFDSSFSDFTRTSVEGERASAESIFHFMVDVPTAYDIMGMFSVSDALGTTIPGNVELEVDLVDITDMMAPPITLFYSYQVSKETIDQSFDVGGMDGDFANVLDGSIFGVLEPGKLYKYRTLVTTNAIDIDGGGPMSPTDGGATAAGAHVILFEAASAVPEPSAFAALSLLGIGLTIRRRRRNCEPRH